MGALELNDCGCQRAIAGCACNLMREHRVGVEPTLPRYEGGVLAAGRPVPVVHSLPGGMGSEGFEPSLCRLKVCCAAVTPQPRLVGCGCAFQAMQSDHANSSDRFVQRKTPGVVCDTGLCFFDRDGPSGVIGAGDTAGLWPVDWPPDRCGSVCLIKWAAGPSLSFFPWLFVSQLAGARYCMFREEDADSFLLVRANPVLSAWPLG